MVMAVILFLGAILVGLGGMLILANAQGAIHEIEAFILLLIAAVLGTGAFIVEALSLGFKKVTKALGEKPV